MFLKTSRDINGTVGNILYGLYLLDICYFMSIIFIGSNDMFIAWMNALVLSGYMQIYLNLKR